MDAESIDLPDMSVDAVISRLGLMFLPELDRALAGSYRVLVPGGTAAEPIWEALVEVKVTRPGDFVRALLTRDSGRLAWFYDSTDRAVYVCRAAQGAADAIECKPKALLP